MSVNIKFPAADVLEERQRIEDERAFLAGAANVEYMATEDALLIHMNSGAVVQIPRRFVDEISTAPQKTLQSELVVGVGGDVISVRSLDVDVSIVGLLRDVFGFNSQRLGGLAKTEAKAHAARINGAKGGRPKSAASKMRDATQASIDMPVSHDELVIVHEVTRGTADGTIGIDKTISVPLSRANVTVGKRKVVLENVDIGKRAVNGDELLSDKISCEKKRLKTSGL